jgi:hypothetical protein
LREQRSYAKGGERPEYKELKPFRFSTKATKLVTFDERSNGREKMFIGIKPFPSKGIPFFKVSSGTIARAFLMKILTVDGECEVPSLRENFVKISSHNQIRIFSDTDDVRPGAKEFSLSFVPGNVLERGDIA